jgi:hypothetical protein
MRNAYNISSNLMGRDHPEDLGAYRRIILKMILGKEGGKVWTVCIWLRIGSSGGCLLRR